MERFENDYSIGCHARILERLAEENGRYRSGYGCDAETERVRGEILRMCGLARGSVYFLTGGTQTNLVAIDRLAPPGEGVLCTEDAHINVHEAGAIEGAGHKVITVDSADGKLSAETVDAYMRDFYADATWPHRVLPAMVYISQPTELGTLYSRAELEALGETCRRHDLRLYADGARLVYALASHRNDVTLRDLARECDGFYIGGTKAGLLFGEALVMKRPDDDRRLFTLIKRHGALTAKGWLAAVQFDELLCKGLYKEIGATALAEADAISAELERLGARRYIDSPTNQRFYEVSSALLQQIREKYVFEIWGVEGAERSVVRFVTSVRP